MGNLHNILRNGRFRPGLIPDGSGAKNPPRQMLPELAAFAEIPVEADVLLRETS
jgi:hypothetical protein